MKIDEIRDRFLEFFKRNGHAVIASDSLVPANDPSLLFTGAGMNQFKDDFLGRGTHGKRAASCQKCLRTGDLDRVGRTPAHQTFFEMLGNFSFGDYFKRESIAWGWEFLTRELRIDESRLSVTVYTDDDEAFKIWHEMIGLATSRITRMGATDNFWPANAPTDGPNGPCGPCSEIYFDFGAKTGCGRPECGPACSCGRFVEIWNHVFTQFDRQGDGTLKPLPQKNIDTGMGLERISAVMQGVHSNFDTNVFLPVIQRETEILKTDYTPGTESSARLRRIADHARALVFCIADNAMPGNTGRGYVVRRILRTAVRDGVKLGTRREFLHELVGDIVHVMRKPYPYLKDRQQTIESTIRSEETKFLNALDRAERELRERLGKSKVLSGGDAFFLYDTHGLHIELLEDLCNDLGARVDRDAFNKILKDKQDAQRTTGEIMDSGALADIKAKKLPKTEFLGYRIPMIDLAKPVDGNVLAIAILNAEALKVYNGSKRDAAAVTTLLKTADLVDEARAGCEVAVLLDRTPFYGDGGGQVGDTGWLRGSGEVEVTDTKKPDDYFLHLGRVTKGAIKTGETLGAAIDAKRRLDIMRNHTGTHVLQAALRAVLGTHVEQAGSIVLPDRLRFDFTHPKGLTRDEVRKIEDWCNDVILADVPVTKIEMSKDEATKSGAIMFFGEKYGERVRVVTVGERRSVEFCGGTHLEHSGTISQMKIVSESSIGSGVRRIEAVTGPKAIEAARERYDLADAIATELKCTVAEVPKRLTQLVKDVQELKSKLGSMRTAAPVTYDAKEVGAEKIAVGKLAGNVDDARDLMDDVTKQKKFAAGIFAVDGGEKPVFIIGVRDDLVKAKGLKAGDLAKEIGRACGGGGGGRELQAQAGASDASKIPLGFETFERLVRAKLG
jgi:alanyl-tRNA synthetase